MLFRVRFSLGVDPSQDEHGLTNILLIGVGGGERIYADKGINLPILMMVAASIFLAEHWFPSIPRDLYVETLYVRGRINKLFVMIRQFICEISVNSQSMQILFKTLNTGEESDKSICGKLEAEADAMATESPEKRLEEIPWYSDSTNSTHWF